MGLSVQAFDSMTPRELEMYARAFRERLDREREERQQAIYLAAFLTSRFVWMKRAPPYERVFAGKTRPAMTDEQMLRMAEALNGRFGGTDTRKEAGEWPS